jgi:CubicO group peptidase (beta-lactamase class C family)
MRRTRWHIAAAAALLLATAALAAEEPTPDLSGLWAAKLRFGPDIKGPLFILREAGNWRADLAGFSVPVQVEGERLWFELPDGKGSFRGRLSGGVIAGQWIQERSATGGTAYASPLTLRADGRGRWRGEVTPREDTMTWYLPLKRDGGGYSAYLRNPERNQGRFMGVSRLELSGDGVRLLGKRGDKPDAVVASGRYDAQREMMTLPLRGASFDFARDPSVSSPFHPRGKPGERYRYSVPLRLDDGWPVATLEEAGISRAAIEAFVQRLIDTPMDGIGSSQIHSVLIARHGKLVLEEYFHGYDRSQVHDMRSAVKSLTATLIGAAMEAGMPIKEDTPVYRTMLGTVPEGSDPRKATMTLRHLLTMTSGHFCDDSNDDAPGNENVMQEQGREPDWYRYILALPMDRTPGEKLVYCSADAVLAGGLLRKAAGEPLPELFERLVARPLQMGPYYLNLTPTGEAYTAGGSYFRPRDFLKLAQLMLNEGTWGGRRIVSREWVRKAATPLHALNAHQQYGYFWNVSEYPWKGRKVRAVFAAGNGGQIFMAIPELGLAIAFTGGAYADASLLIPQRELVPNAILPAVE